MSSAPISSTSAATGWRRIFTAERVALFLLILAAALPYLSSLTFGFVYDDLGVIVEVPAADAEDARRILSEDDAGLGDSEAES